MPDTDFARLITLDPAHFHAALVQKQMLPGIDRRVAVYASPGPDLQAHVKLIEQFNQRPDNPTHWELDVHESSAPLKEMIAARLGNVVVLAGRNRSKIGKIIASLEAGLNVLADKPWIIQSQDLPALERALSLAAQKGLVAYDVMTERHEITNILQRELVFDPAVFGVSIPANQSNPAVYMESTHYIFKKAGGSTAPRSPSFFDIADQGEGLTDIGTHLVDLVQWTLFPGQALDYRRDVQVQAGKRWATRITGAQFQQLASAAATSGQSAPPVHVDSFDYYYNNQVDYQVRRTQVRLKVVWEWESAAGVDTHYAIYRGTRASVEVRQTAKENYLPELFVIPHGKERRAAVIAAVQARLDRLQSAYPGIGCEPMGDELHITIPERYRVGHEAHFAQVLDEFLKYLKSPQSMPAWERPNMLAKYFTTCAGVRT